MDSICFNKGYVKSVTKNYEPKIIDLTESSFDTFITFIGLDYHILFEGNLNTDVLTFTVFKGITDVWETGEVYYIRPGTWYYEITPLVGFGIKWDSLEYVETYRVDIDE